MAWTYEYTPYDRQAEWSWYEKAQLRPTVPVQIGGAVAVAETFVALVDSGCDHVLAPEWIARLAGVEPDANREVSIQIAGAARRVRFGDLTLRLCSPTTAFGDAEPESVAEWRTPVGFFLNWADPPWTVILGQCGFFDQFTVIMSRLSQRLTVEPAGAHDEWYPPSAAPEDRPSPPRFQP